MKIPRYLAIVAYPALFSDSSRHTMPQATLEKESTDDWATEEALTKQLEALRVEEQALLKEEQALINERRALSLQAESLSVRSTTYTIMISMPWT